MNKSITQKNREIYDYMVEANKKIILSGKDIESVCYAIVFNKKDDFSIFPIPLSQAGNANERRALLSEVGKILKINKVKVKMFMLSTTARIFKKENEEDKKECILFSARDYLDNQRNSVYEIIKKENGVELKEMEDNPNLDWKTKGKIGKDKPKFEDSLLNSVWSEYRKLK